MLLGCMSLVRLGPFLVLGVLKVATYTVALGQRINIPSWGSGLGKKRLFEKCLEGKRLLWKMLNYSRLLMWLDGTFKLMCEIHIHLESSIIHSYESDAINRSLWLWRKCVDFTLTCWIVFQNNP